MSFNYGWGCELGLEACLGEVGGGFGQVARCGPEDGVSADAALLPQRVILTFIATLTANCLI